MFRLNSGQEGLMLLVGWLLAFICRHVVVAQGRSDELPFQEHGTGRSLYPADKVSIAVLSRSV